MIGRPVTIDGGDELYRRIWPDHIRKDGRLNRGAYVENGQPAAALSVDLAQLTTVDACAGRRPGCGVGGILARIPIGLGFQPVHDPQPDNPAHSLLRGDNTRAKCAALAEATAILKHPPPRS